MPPCAPCLRSGDVTILPGLPSAMVTRRRYPPTDYSSARPALGVPTDSDIEAIEEPWRPDAVVERPADLTAATSRLFVCTTEITPVAEQATADARPPDRIVSSSGTWEAMAVIRAPAMPGIPAAWHAYCRLVRPLDEP